MPERIAGFEDTIFLFHNDSQANFGIILQNLENAAYLYKTIKQLTAPKIVEIGRHRGGSTFLLASAADDDAQITSIDLFVPDHSENAGPKTDEALKRALSKYGWDKKVKLVVSDSTTYKAERESLDLVLIDGDHSYEGVKKDFLNFYPAVKKQGHILFDDSSPTRFGSCSEGVVKLLREIENDGRFSMKKVTVMGTMSHYRKI